MAVPSSGQLSILGLAREKVYDNYSSTSTPTAPYSLKDIATSGSSGGSGTSFESTNTNGKDTTGTVTTSAETNVSNNQFTMNGSISSYGGGGMNIVIPHKMSEFYGYNHGTALPGFSLYYYASRCTDVSCVCGSSNTMTVYSSTATSASDIFLNQRVIYQDSAGTTLAPAYWYAAGTNTGDRAGKWSNAGSGSWTSTSTCGQ